MFLCLNKNMFVRSDLRVKILVKLEFILYNYRIYIAR